MSYKAAKTLIAALTMAASVPSIAQDAQNSEAAADSSAGAKGGSGKTATLPISREITTSAAMQNAQEGLTDATKDQAGVAPTNSKGSPADDQAIRGIKLNLFSNFRLDGGLAIAGVMTTPIEDKARVETLKGANALMYGVASPAGIINLVTKRAPLHDVQSVLFSSNYFGQYGMAVDLSHRFGSAKEFGVRLNASGTRLENGVRGASGKFGFASIGADWKIAGNLNAQLDLETYRKDVIEQASINLPAVKNNTLAIPAVPDPRKLLSGSWSDYFALTTNMQGRVDYHFSPDWKIFAQAGESDSDRSRNTARISNYNIATGANGTVTVNPVTQKYFNRFARTEVVGRFDTWSLKHDLDVGVSVSERPAETPSQNSIVLPQKQNIYDPVVLPAPVPTKAPTQLPLQVDRDIGMYTYDTVTIIPQLRGLLGFREIRTLADDGRTSTGTYVPAPAAGVLYDVLPGTTLFASYMKGLEDGGVGPVNSVNPYQILPPAVSTQEEIGIRTSSFDGLSVNASVFDINRANAVISSTTKIYANDGTINYTGAEMVLREEFSRQWSLAAAGEWLNAVQHPVDDQTIGNKPPENTPKWIGNTSLSYRPYFVPGWSLTASTSMVSKRPADPQNHNYIAGYALLGLGTGYSGHLGTTRVSVQINADNVLNKRYWNSAQTGTLGIGMDTSVRASLKLEF